MNVTTKDVNLFYKSPDCTREVNVAIDIYSGSNCPEIFQNLSVTSAYGISCDLAP